MFQLCFLQISLRSYQLDGIQIYYPSKNNFCSNQLKQFVCITDSSLASDHYGAYYADMCWVVDCLVIQHTSYESCKCYRFLGPLKQSEKRMHFRVNWSNNLPILRNKNKMIGQEALKTYNTYLAISTIRSKHFNCDIITPEFGQTHAEFSFRAAWSEMGHPGTLTQSPGQIWPVFRPFLGVTQNGCQNNPEFVQTDAKFRQKYKSFSFWLSLIYKCVRLIGYASNWVSEVWPILECICHFFLNGHLTHF